MFDITSRLHKFDYRMIQRAMREAELSDFHHFKTGSVITYKNHIISLAHNTEKTSPEQMKYNTYRDFNNNNDEVIHKTHAEILAIKKISYSILNKTDWSKANIYIARISPGNPGGVGLARPCPACMKAISDLGIRNIFYTGDTKSLVYERINTL